jgi:hypothetical protein
MEDALLVAMTKRVREQAMQSLHVKELELLLLVLK